MAISALAKAAITVALTVAQIGLGMLRTIEGPRLTELDGSVADYGTALPTIYNRRRVSAPCMFCEDIIEHKRTRKTKGGKYKEYTYFGTWASVICAHEITSIKRIWFDAHLVYDVDAATGATSIFDLHEDYELENAVRFYLGTEAQEPDPRMLATIEAAEGADTCPAYKGVAYIMFEDIPLEKIGNRFPQVSVEVVGLTGAMIDTLLAA